MEDADENKETEQPQESQHLNRSTTISQQLEVAAKSVPCVKCGVPLGKPTFKFCTIKSCRAKQPARKQCKFEECGEMIDADLEFCDQCGYDQTSE